MKLTRRQIGYLRALLGGPMTPDQWRERLGCYPDQALAALARAGLIRIEGTSNRNTRHHLTEQGRRHCPPRNPAAAARRIPTVPVVAGLRQRQGIRHGGRA
jgi:hypothetical protein